MGRAYTSVIPPEYQTVATQVTEMGTPKYPAITRQNYGTIGRSVMDTNDLQDQGSGPEVYDDHEDPLARANLLTAQMVAKMQKQFAISETPNTNVEKVIAKTKVTYNPEISRDAQVSNVQGMRFTGDPETVGQAMKYHGDAKFQTGRALDGSDIQATIDRAASGMDKASRSSLAQALADMGPEALESLPSTNLAGLAESVTIAGTAGLAGLTVGATGLVPPRLPAVQTGGGQQTPDKVRAVGLRAAAARAQAAQRAAAAKKNIPFRAAQQKGNVAQEAVPAAFKKLAAERALEARQALMRRPTAKVHPSQTNYEDPNGQMDTTSAQSPATARRKIQQELAKMRAMLQAAWNQMTPAQRAQAKKFLAAAARRWQKMTPAQRQRAMVQFTKMMQAWSAQAAQARQQQQLQTTIKAKTGDGIGPQELQAAADAQNGDPAAQATMDRASFQAEERRKALQQLTRAWQAAVKRLTPEQQQQAKAFFNKLRQAWMNMTPKQRRQSLANFRKQVAALRQAGAQQAAMQQAAASQAVSSGPASPGAGEDAQTYVSDTGLTYTGDSLMDQGYMYDDQGDITEESMGEPEASPETDSKKWLIIGGIAAAGITGAMLFASPKGKK